MGNIISGDAEINYIINQFNKKLESMFAILVDIKKYIILDKEEQTPETRARDDGRHRLQRPYRLC